LWRVYGWSLLWAVQMVYCGLLLLIGLVDLQYSRIPNVLVGTGMVVALTFNLWHRNPGIGSALAGAALGGGIFALLAVARRNAMGMGDVKLAVLIGTMTGFPGVLQALTLGILAGGLAAALFLVARLRRRNQYMPYGPYLVVGCLATLLYGQRIATWYATWLASGG
jgi:prepilin signal peptidase PulO-like enzyme (type II secretory pathway)